MRRSKKCDVKPKNQNVNAVMHGHGLACADKSLSPSSSRQDLVDTTLDTDSDRFHMIRDPSKTCSIR